MTRKKMRMTKIKKFASFALLVLFITPIQANFELAHKFYMSITEIECNPVSKSLQISMKLFADDFENILKEEEGVQVFLGTPKEHKSADQFIFDYVKIHFFVEQSKGSLPLTYVGKEVDKDYIWVYIEVKNFKVKDETLLTNSMFLDYFNDQTNRINYTKDEEVISFTLHKQKVSHEF